MAALLGGFGLYGVIAYSVSQRTREIGIRMALGAQVSAVRLLVIGQAIFIAGAGVGVGLGVSLISTRLLATQLYGISPSDPLTLTVAAIALMGVALLALHPRDARRSRSAGGAKVRMKSFGFRYDGSGVRRWRITKRTRAHGSDSITETQHGNAIQRHSWHLQLLTTVVCGNRGNHTGFGHHTTRQSLVLLTRSCCGHCRTMTPVSGPSDRTQSEV